MTKRKPRRAPATPVVFETLEVRPDGHGLDGHVLRMRFPSVRLLIARRRGEADREAYWEEVVDAIVEHDLDRDPDRLTVPQITAIGTAWADAMKAAAVPPESGTG